MNKITKMIKIPVLAVASVFATISVCSHAGTSSYSPADFNFSGQELVETMATISSGNHVLYCRSVISTSGSANSSYCFGKTLSYTTISAAERALNQLSFVPATINGQSVPVRMSYRIALNEKDGSTAAHMLPNLGTMSAKYGDNYSAPQERLDTSDWYVSYSQKSKEKAQPFFGMGDNARIAALVNTKGKVSAIGVVEAKKTSRKDSKLAASALKKAPFIPGMINGKEVKMDYVVGLNHNNVNYSLASN